MHTETERMLHVAVQYLAAAGVNFVEKQEDDSHTNMCWDYYTESYSTHQLSNGDILFFHPSSMTLRWRGGDDQELKLPGLTHKEVVQWLDEVAQAHGLAGYDFALHYEIHGGAIADDYQFEHPNLERIAVINSYRGMSQKACTNTLSRLEIEQNIRVWPHHFDTGGFVALKGDSGISVGFGLGIPDDKFDTYYLYVTGWRGHDSISVGDMPSLTKGSWITERYVGAMLPVKGLTQDEYDQFFVEAIQAFSGQ